MPGYRYDIQASQPNIDGISFKFYDNREWAIRDLEDNKIDYIPWAMPESKINMFANNPDLGLKYLKNAGGVNIAYNMRSKSFGYDHLDPFSVDDLGKPLRKALANCIDTRAIDGITKFALEGENLGLFNELKNASAPIYTYDLNEAIGILEKQIGRAHV